MFLITSWCSLPAGGPKRGGHSYGGRHARIMLAKWGLRWWWSLRCRVICYRREWLGEAGSPADVLAPSSRRSLHFNLPLNHTQWTITHHFSSATLSTGQVHFFSRIISRHFICQTEAKSSLASCSWRRNMRILKCVNESTFMCDVY